MSTPTFLHPFASPSLDREAYVSIVKGDGSLVWDTEGNEYIDAMASLWYAAIGYGRKEIADAVGDQTAKLGGFHTFTSWTNPQADALADRIADLSPYDNGRVFFCGSGSEAVESVMKLARAAQTQAGHPERTLIVSRERGYHGVGYGGTSASGLPPNQASFGPFVGDVVTVDADDLSKMAAVLEERRGEVAAVITEPVQGAGGVWPPSGGYLKGLRELCDAHGAYLIFDEVITGFGRLGTWFAADRFDVKPDLMTFAKAVTSGYVPLGGVIVSDAIRDTIEADPDFVFRHGFTYSGHPVACRAGLANLEIMERESLLDRVPDMESTFRSRLGSLLDSGAVGDVRGIGGMWAVGMRPGVSEADVFREMLSRGVITRAVPGAITLCPPLVITDEQLNTVVDVLEQSLG
ncbi:MAG: aspartate aminotransferase family protein [Acidimicrobiia bacterium]